MAKDRRQRPGAAFISGPGASLGLLRSWLAGVAIVLTAGTAIVLALPSVPNSILAVGTLGAVAVLGLVMFRMTRLDQNSEANKRVLEDEALELLRTTRTLKYREDRVRRIISNAADAYVETDQEGLIQGWNGKAAEMFGYAEEEAMGSPLSDILVGGRLDGLSQEMRLMWCGSDRFDGKRLEAEATDRRGRRFPVEVTVWVDESDFEPKMSMFMRDITVRRNAEERLQNALSEEQEAVRRLQEIDQAKNDFVSSISHELRSPLTSTLGYLELLIDGDAGELTAEQLHMIEVAERNGKRLRSLIEDLLTLSHIESGDFAVKYRPVDVRSAVQTAVESFMAQAAERGVEMSVDMEAVLGVCPGDGAQLIRALGNVVGNAVKFTPPTGQVKVFAEARGNEVLVRVQDNGMGIPGLEQAKVFERFFRTSLSIEQQHQGAGLGLTIAKTIVDHHGGSIAIDSELGVGTTVSIRLPMLVGVSRI